MIRLWLVKENDFHARFQPKHWSNEKLVRYSTFDIRYSNGEVNSIFDIRYSNGES